MLRQLLQVVPSLLQQQLYQDRREAGRSCL
jgi:hypothetical protein